MFVYEANGKRVWREQQAPGREGPHVYQAHNGYYDRFWREPPQEPHWTNRVRIGQLDKQAELYERMIAQAEHYTTGPGFPGPTNVVIPTLEASGKLTVGFSRNPKRFVLPRYVQYVTSGAVTGLYMKLSAQEAARVVSLPEHDWGYGTPRPVQENTEQFNLIQYFCKRRNVSYFLDRTTVQGAAWPIHEQHQQIKAAQMMTIRTQEVVTLLTTATNWQTAADPDLSANHTDTAANVAGGFVNNGTSTDPLFMKFLNTTDLLISKDTLSVVQYDGVNAESVVLMGPNDADRISRSAEIHDYIKGSYFAKEELNTHLQPNGRFGLPSQVYGRQIGVEDAVKVTSRKGATLAKSYVWPDNTIVIASRVGGMEGVYGTPSWSTATWFYFQDELTVEVFADAKNRIDEGHVCQNGVAVLTSPLSGYLLTSATQ